MMEAASTIVNAAGFVKCIASIAPQPIGRASLTMSLLDSLEKRFGRYAIRGIVGYIVFFQCLTFAILYTKPDFRQVLEIQAFGEMAAGGEYWRLISFMALPEGGGSKMLGLLMFIFYAGVLLYIMHPVEEALGTFRMNLFVLLYIAMRWVQAALMGTGSGAEVIAFTGGQFEPGSNMFYQNLFFAFAVLHPGIVFRLYGLIPIPVWVLALISAALMLLALIAAPRLYLSMLLSLAPFLCFALPRLVRHLRHRSTVAVRRSRYEASSCDMGGSFHKCSLCGRSDASDPDLDFRVAEDGTEFCTDHLPR